MPRLEIAIVHDYLTQRGGAERVVLSMLKMYPGAPLYTAVYDPDGTYPEFADYDVRPLWTNRVPSFRRDHRRGFLLYPFAFSGLTIDADVVLCSSSGFAHGVKTTGRKVVYCHTPARWLYDEASTYLAGWPAPAAALAKAAGPALRHWDRRAASGADTYVSNSTTVRDRIRRTYNIEAEVVAPPTPPFTIGAKRSVAGITPGFLLCVSRLLAYKNIEAISNAFAYLPEHRLLVVGTGPEQSHIQQTAGPNVSLLGWVDDPELAWLYANCAGLVAAGHEDYGLAPLEAATCGKPVAALRSGGFLDTVVEGKTGVFFNTPDAVSIATAVRELLETSWANDAIEAHAADFTESSFTRRLFAAIGVISRADGPRQPPRNAVAA